MFEYLHACYKPVSCPSLIKYIEKLHLLSKREGHAEVKMACMAGIPENEDRTGFTHRFGTVSEVLFGKNSVGVIDIPPFKG